MTRIERNNEYHKVLLIGEATLAKATARWKAREIRVSDWLVQRNAAHDWIRDERIKITKAFANAQK